MNPFIKKENRIIWNITTDIFYRLFIFPIQLYFGCLTSAFKCIKKFWIKDDLDDLVEGCLFFNIWLYPFIVYISHKIGIIPHTDHVPIILTLMMDCLFAVLICMLSALVMVCVIGLFINLYQEYIKILKNKYGDDFSK